MREFTAAGFSAVSQTQLFLPGGKQLRWENSKGMLRKKERWCCHAKAWQPMNQKPSAFTLRFSTDVPLYESPGASFDEYLEDKPRVFKAMFPDSIQVNEGERKIELPPFNFLFLAARLVVDVRLICKSSGEDYPFGVPHTVKKILEFDITRWDLQGLHTNYQPPHFALSVKGVVYPDRRGKQSRLRNQMEIKLSFIASPALALASHHVLQSIAESVCKAMMEDMKVTENGRLVADYYKFKREMRVKNQYGAKKKR
ncbi:uncharacterized protein LOC107415957 isoform X1 [Ziziphus jujuba]|uniref:Uncharacterized protein LOC107415957 isoform X1 n=1 Tax=Ziziphus jujuba TaxID=326968 RepID=A0A6P3ZMA7_ZIZJJ|nr:uncharacterized protein LOC107415957 isoform X1 [Ziziphus jujuba]